MRALRTASVLMVVGSVLVLPRFASAEVGYWDKQPLMMFDLTFRNGEYLGASFVAGHDVALGPDGFFHRIGLAGRGGLALGGASAQAEVIAYTDCPHGLPYCTELSLGPKVVHAWWVSSWRHGEYVGGEATLGIFLIKTTIGVFRSFTGAKSYVQFGAGLGF